MIDHLKLLLRINRHPSEAISAVLDQGSLLFASLSVVAVSLLFKSAVAIPFYIPLLVLAVAYVPGILLLSGLLVRLSGGLPGSFQRDYSPLLTCTAMAWAAANLPVAILGWALPTPVFLALFAAAHLYFLVLIFFVVRTIFGVENRIAAAVVSLSWLPLAAATFLWGPLRFLLGWLASPFFLFYAYYYLGSEIGNLGAGLRQRQNFRRMLNAAALNPHDGEAQYQLGLIYQQRRNDTEAIQRFRKAVAIDPAQTDAHFQLGRIARRQGRLNDALASFQMVIDQDDKHSQNEILRELGAVYLDAGQFEDARRFLEEYLERRPYDPQGHYELGQALTGLGRTAGARAAFERVLEDVATAPRFRRRAIARWSRLAQKHLR